MTRTGILIFDDAEELDFAGPYEVLSAARDLAKASDEVFLVAENASTVRCAKGMKVEPHATIRDAGAIDVLLVPGGKGARQKSNAGLLDWIRTTAERASWVTSVCTGTFMLAEAGLLDHKRVTTHWSFIEQLRTRPNLTVVEGVRYVRDGKLVTAAGVSAGIDMALWLVGQLRGAEFARTVQRYIQYDPAPPYAADA
jgi:transcriptional regulator GlxA family with amidase domain